MADNCMLKEIIFLHQVFSPGSLLIHIGSDRNYECFPWSGLVRYIPSEFNSCLNTKGNNYDDKLENPVALTTFGRSKSKKAGYPWNMINKIGVEKHDVVMKLGML